VADNRLNAQQSKQPAEEPTFDVGVLFVHGIGTQRRGQTRKIFGQAIHDWLQDRLRGLDHQWREAINAHPQRLAVEEWRTNVEDWATDGFHPENPPIVPDPALLTQLAKQLGCDTVVGRVSVPDSVIDDTKDRSAPAHTALTLQRRRIDGALETERWLLAESWWQESFLPSDFIELAPWAALTIPWAVGSHFGTQVRRVLGQRSRGMLRWPGWGACLRRPSGSSSVFWRVCFSLPRLPSCSWLAC
jgi:hypothetical protein